MLGLIQNFFKSIGIHDEAGMFLVVSIIFSACLLTAVSFVKKYIRRNWENKTVKIIGAELADEKTHKSEGFGPDSYNPEAICFYMLASESGKKEGFIYKSELYCSDRDDNWYTGKIDGLETVIKVNPENGEKYSMPMNDVPPSQYS